MSPAGLAFAGPGRFSALTARTFLPGLIAAPTSKRPGFSQPSPVPISAPLIQTVKRSSAAILSTAARIGRLSGTVKVRRKNLASTGASRLGSPSLNQIQSPQGGRSAQRTMPGSGSSSVQGRLAMKAFASPIWPEPGSRIASSHEMVP